MVLLTLRIHNLRFLDFYKDNKEMTQENINLVGVGAVFQLEFVHKFSPPLCCICSGSHLHNRRFPA